MNEKVDTSRAKAKAPQELPIDMPEIGEVSEYFANDPQVTGMYAQMQQEHGQPQRSESPARQQQALRNEYPQDYEIEEPQELPQESQPEQEQEESHEEVSPERRRYDREENIRSMRESWERERQEWQKEREYYRQLELEARKANQPQSKQEIEEDFIPIEGPDDNIAEVKDIKRVKEGVKKSIKREVDKVYEELQKTKQEMNLLNTKARINSELPDYYKVVNEKTLNELERRYPQLARSLEKNPDLFAQASGAYSIIKDTGIYESVDKQYMTDKNKAVISQNLNKPKPSASASPQRGSTGLNAANQYANMSPRERDNALIREMNDAISGIRWD